MSVSDPLGTVGRMSSHPAIFPVVGFVAAIYVTLYVLAWVLIVTCVVTFVMVRGGIRLLDRLSH